MTRRSLVVVTIVFLVAVPRQSAGQGTESVPWWHGVTDVDAARRFVFGSMIWVGKGWTATIRPSHDS